MSFYIEIDGWKKGITFSSAHILFGHDTCGFLHGHTYALSARIAGEKSDNDFVIDFKQVKKILKEIANIFDHKILLPKKSKYIRIDTQKITVQINKKQYVFPMEDCVLLPITSITAENLAEYVIEEFLKKIKIPFTIKHIEVGVHEGYGQVAWKQKKVG